MNHTQRHSYYVTRTMKWLESHGYTTKKVETNYTTTHNGHTFYVKKDHWGADIEARHKLLGLWYIQVKTSGNQVAKGVRQLTEDDNWPPEIGRAVVWWDKGARLAHGPNTKTITTASCGDTLCPLPNAEDQRH